MMAPGRIQPPGVAIPGVWVDFGGNRTYLLPPLSLGNLETMQEDLAALPSMSALEPRAVATIINASHAALRRNYPAMTREEVGDLVDVSNMGEVYENIMDIAGVKRLAQAEAAAGNVSAGAESAGAASSPASAQTPDGLGTMFATA